MATKKKSKSRPKRSRAKRSHAKRAPKRRGIRIVSITTKGTRRRRGKGVVITLRDNPGKKRKHKRAKMRKNPRTIKSSRPRVLTPENCKRKTASQLLLAIKKAKKGHKKQPKRIGNCTKQSASVALHQTPVRGQKSKKGSTYGGQAYIGPKNAKKVLKERAKSHSRSKSRSRTHSRGRAAAMSTPKRKSLISWMGW